MVQKILDLWRSYTGIVLAIVAAVGFALLAGAQWLDSESPARAIATQLGTILLTGALVQVIAQYLVWREAEARIVRYFGLKEEVVEAGFQRMVWFDRVDWAGLFAKASTVDIFFTSNTNWVENNLTRLKEFMASKERSLTVVLRSPRELEGLERRFTENPGERAGRIRRTARMLLDAHSQIDVNARGQLTLKHHPCDATHTFYRFDECALFVPYKLRPGRDPGAIPALFFGTEGKMYKEFLQKDFNHLVSEAKEFSADDLGPPQPPAREREVANA